VAATTDRPSYGPGEVVNITGTLRNRSSQTCTYAATIRLEIRDGAGKTVWGPIASHADYFAGGEPTLASGESAPTLSLPWDQQVCDGMHGCKPAPPGGYTIVADVAYGTVTVPVTIRPA
jgi:hypothetical protein